MFGRRSRRLGLAAIAGVIAVLALPAVASATPCTLPAGPSTSLTYDAAQDFSGSFAQANQGDFVQVPFTVPAGTTGIRIRYCYDSTASTVLDMGVYEPLHSGDTVPGMPERRGWSGSAVKDLAISKNGFSPAAVYDNGVVNHNGPDRKKFVEGYTTRAYQPGDIPAGTWTAELGLAYLGIPSTDWKVRVETSSDAGWANNAYSPHAYDSTAAKDQAGWYAGDLHAHGEEEPGNDLMKTSFDYAFKSIADGGAGLDFLGLVDHNNSISRGEIGRYQGDYPGKLIIPGTEVTTYHGHYNTIGSSAFADFRGGSVYGWDQSANAGAGALTAKRQDPVTPGSQMQAIQDGGGWTQVNHPTIFSNAPSVCRGCAWDWSDADTDYSKVNAIELQTGPADLGNPGTATVQNPYTPQAIAFYEQKLALGDHIAAVGSSDSHKANFTDATTSPIGQATTVVHATELSHDAIVQGIKAGHTYVKFYGNDGPDIRVDGTAAGYRDAIVGDTLKGTSGKVAVTVTGAGTRVRRPGPEALQLLKDGATSGAAIPITSANFSHTFDTTGPGRYSLEVTRMPSDPLQEVVTPARYELYTTPIWFEKATNLKLTGTKLDQKRGRATLSATVTGKGKLKLSGKSLKGSSATVKQAGTGKLKVTPKGKLARTLAKKGKAKVSVKVTFSPTGGQKISAKKKLTLKQRH